MASGRQERPFGRSLPLRALLYASFYAFLRSFSLLLRPFSRLGGASGGGRRPPGLPLRYFTLLLRRLTSNYVLFTPFYVLFTSFGLQAKRCQVPVFIVFWPRGQKVHVPVSYLITAGGYKVHIPVFYLITAGG